MPRSYRIDVTHPALLPHSRITCDLLDGAGWSRTEGEDWSFYWSSSIPSEEVFASVTRARFVNHLPGIPAITSKDGLAWMLELAHLEQPEVYDFHPETYVFPEEHAELLAAAAREPEAVWICKPAASSNGRGIRLLSDPLSVEAEPDVVVQRYLDRPDLIDGFKYTLRFFVAVTSLEPLRAFLFEDGLTKLTTRPFRRDRGSFEDTLVHLTNPEVQRRNSEVVASERNMSHTQLRQRLRARGVDVEGLWARIRGLVGATMRAAAPFLIERGRELLPSNPGTAFELLGLDILIDEAMRPWLLECNLSPSLRVEAAGEAPFAVAERDIKTRAVRDLYREVGLLPIRPEEPSGYTLVT